MGIATLIAAEHLKKGALVSAVDRLGEAGCKVLCVSEIVDEKASDISFEGELGTARSALEEFADDHDIAVTPAEHREKKLLISDMDSTMITVECIDELADYAGIKEKVAKVTEQAMRGEIDFEGALRGRVSLLEGLDLSAIDRCLSEKVNLMPGAATLVKTMASRGAHTVLVSGGFTHFAEPVAAQIGFDIAVANQLAHDAGKLTGGLNGPIVDAARKAELLADEAQKLDLGLHQSLAIGDGANDIPMIAKAGLGVAYHAKPKAAAAADVAIRHNDLTALLYVQGITAKDWVRG